MTTDVAGLIEWLKSAQKWMREPDFASEFTMPDFISWSDRRPLTLFFQAAEALTRLTTPPTDEEARERVAGILRAELPGITPGWVANAATAILAEFAPRSELDAARAEAARHEKHARFLSERWVAAHDAASAAEARVKVLEEALAKERDACAEIAVSFHAVNAPDVATYKAIEDHGRLIAQSIRAHAAITTVGDR